MSCAALISEGAQEPNILTKGSNERVGEWEPERCHIWLHVDQLDTEVADKGRCRKKLADDIRTGL